MKKNIPLVSIGLIAYNRAQTLRPAIKSLLRQSYKNIEIIISDDASTDKSAAVAETFAKKDKRIRLFRQKKNIGLPHNSNFVLNKAAGEYFMWAADDDTWHKDFIKILVNELVSHPSAGLAMCNFDLYTAKVRKKVRMNYPSYSSGIPFLRSYLKETPLLVWGLFRTKLLRKAGGFFVDGRPFLSWGSDNVTVFKVLLISGFCFTKKCLWQKRDSGHALKPFQGILDFFHSEDIRKRVYRYMAYPIMFLFDYFAFIRSIHQSSYKSWEKWNLFMESTQWLLRVNLHFMSTLFQGLRHVFFSLFSKQQTQI